jgi:hypothetical protein
MAKAAKKKAPTKADVAARRAKAYSYMETHVCDLVSMGRLAMEQFDKDEALFIFAVGKLEDMLIEFKAHYYAEEFPRHETSTPIGQREQPATDRQPRKTAQAVTDRQPDQSIIRQLRMCNAFRSINLKARRLNPAGFSCRLDSPKREIIRECCSGARSQEAPLLP